MKRQRQRQRLLPAHEFLVALADGSQLCLGVAVFSLGDKVRTGCSRVSAGSAQCGQLVAVAPEGLSRAHAKDGRHIELLAVQAQVFTAALHGEHRHPISQFVAFRAYVRANVRQLHAGFKARI